MWHLKVVLHSTPTTLPPSPPSLPLLWFPAVCNVGYIILGALQWLPLEREITLSINRTLEDSAMRRRLVLHLLEKEEEGTRLDPGLEH